MTWTDLFYQAAVETLSDKYVYITRYPISSYNSIFPSLCRPLSTIDTVPAIINGVEYRWYPVIDLNTPTGKISNLFNDTVCMSDLYLDALGGDFEFDHHWGPSGSNSRKEKFGEHLTSGVCKIAC